MASTLCQKWLKNKRIFVKHFKIPCSLDHTILFKFHWHELITFFKECMKRFKTFNVSIATVAGRSFNGRFTAKIDDPIGHFMLPLLMLTLEV